MDSIVNKVAGSGIVTLDLSDFMAPDQTVAAFDLKPFLFRELILKEKDYRTMLAGQDWAAFSGKHVAITCTTDAIIPMWAYMLAATYLAPVASSVYFGSPEDLKKQLLIDNISSIEPQEYADKRVVIKGCADTAIPEAAYVRVTSLLQPVVKSLMYGEPCSTVPIYKKK